MNLAGNPMTRSKQQLQIFSLFMLIVLLARVLPHMPNFSPLLALVFLSPKWLNNKAAIFFTLVSVMLSDIIIAYQFNTHIFGYWTLFTYSAILCVFFIGRFGRHAKLLTNGALLTSASLGYWIWTNFGVWLLDSMYSLTLQGLADCYVAALPFLKTSLLGDLTWFGIISVITAVLSPRWQDASRYCEAQSNSY